VFHPWTAKGIIAMPKPGEHKTVQARILKYAQEIGWTFVSRAEAEQRRGFRANGGSISEQSAKVSVYFDDLLFAKLREFNPKYSEAEGALTGDPYLNSLPNK
jgi:type I restriction enzyme R subunit